MSICFDLLEDVLNDWITNNSSTVIVTDGTTDTAVAVDSVNVSSDITGIIVEFEWSNTQSYDGYILKSLQVGNFIYPLSGTEVEGGYLYLIRMYVSIDGCITVSC